MHGFHLLKCDFVPIRLNCSDLDPFSSVHFGQPLTFHQFALILAATPEYYLLKYQKERGTIKDRLQNRTLKNYTEE